MIPAEIREELGLREGDRLSVHVEDGRVVLQSPLVAFDRLRDEFRRGAAGRDLVAELIAERRREAQREEEELERYRNRS